MDLRQHYQAQYTFEATRKTDLTAALALPIGVLSLLLGALVVMAKELRPPLATSEAVELAFVCLSALACCLAAVLLVRSLYNFAYGYLPTPLHLKEYCDSLVKYYCEVGHEEPEAKRLAEAETLEYLDGELAKNTNRNATNNDIKSAFLHRANGALVAASALAAVAGIAYVSNSLAAPPTVHRVEIVPAKEPATMQNSLPVQAASAPPPAAPTPAPATKPEPPPSRVVREHRDPPKPPPLKR